MKLGTEAREGAEKGYGLPLGGSRYLVSGSLDINKREILTQAFGLSATLAKELGQT